MSKELVIIYDTPSMVHDHIMKIHNLVYYLKYFDKIHVLYWSKEEFFEVFKKENGKFIFYPYPKPYNSGYITGLKFMTWIAKTLWKICSGASKGTELILMPLIPIWAGLPTLLVGKLKRKKVILRLEHPKIEGLKIEDETLGVPKIFIVLKMLILKIIYFLTIPLYDLVFGISSYVLEGIKAYNPKRPRVIHLPINIVRFRPRNIKKGKEIIILSVGQMKKRKGFCELIQALQFLKKENNITPKLLIVGRVTNPRDKAFVQEFKDLAKGLNVEFRHNVKHHDELARIYNEADILVSASYIEGLGMVVMEAMASGLPVIATGNSGSRDVVEDGKTGFLIEPKDPRAIKDNLLVLLRDPDLRKSMGEAGRKRMEKLMKVVDKRLEELWKNQKLEMKIRGKQKLP